MLRGRILTFLCVKIQVFRGRLTAKTAASEAVMTENIGTAAPTPLRKEQQGYCPLISPRRTKTAPIRCRFAVLVEIRGVEPLTSYMRSKRSTN